MKQRPSSGRESHLRRYQADESRSFAARSPAKTRSKLNALSRPFLLRNGILPVRTEQLPYYRWARDLRALPYSPRVGD